MKNFKVDGNLGKFELNLPENLDEITNEYLQSCTEFVHPAPDYALVGVVYKDSLSLVLTAAKKNKPANVAVIPVFIKAGKTDSEFIKSLNIGDKIVVAASDLSIGHHINSPHNKITPKNIIDVCEGDKEIYKDAFSVHKPICFLEFKLIPISAIHGNLDKSVNIFINPFVHKTNITVGEA